MEFPIRGCTVSELLRRAAALWPTQEAVVSPPRGVRLSFADLDRHANVVAAGLLRHGIGRGDRVVLWSVNCPDWVVLQYALARIGAVLVTANTALKRDELTYILGKSRARALVFARGTPSNDFAATVERLDRARLPHLNVLIGMDRAAATDSIALEAVASAAGADARAAVLEVETRLSRDDVINMQYTSGTTGFPKGVMLTHRNLVQNAAAIAPILDFRPGDRLCLCVPLFHCFGCVIGTLVAHETGSALVLVEGFDAAVVLDTIERERCTALYGVPTMFIAELAAQRARPRDLTSLRVGVMAGAPCPEQVMREAAVDLHIPGLVIAYGLTEASPGVTLSSPTDSLDLRATTVGKALPGLAVRIADPDSGVEVARGQSGELWTRGEHVMAGYDDEPEATRRAITTDGWLKTGDMATMDEQGFVRIVGRSKELIIRGGENIAPAEVEDALRVHDAVLDVAAFGVPSAFFGEEVAVAVRMKPERTVSAAELQAFCRARIAEHKVPSRVLFVDQFPLTGSGKVQRFVLREWATSTPT
ncbi:MAG: AMP-binding protein [Planctomycetes bacterium]|nr:AMP-binding protein [Planctomycetota bacterium]